MGFVQVRLEVVAIGINNIAAFVRAGQTSPNIGFKYLSLVKSRAAVSGGRNSNATPAQSPNVICYAAAGAEPGISLENRLSF